MKEIVRPICAVTLLALPFSVSADLSELPSGDYTLDSSNGYITFESTEVKRRSSG